MSLIRFFTPFGIVIGGFSAWSSYQEGFPLEALGWLALALLSGALLWRSARNKNVTRKAGERAIITFTRLPGPGLTQKGAYAQVKTHWAIWDIALDRPPRPEDFDQYGGGSYPGWVWLDESDLPRRIRIRAGLHWAHWDVREAVLVKA